MAETTSIGTLTKDQMSEGTEQTYCAIGEVTLRRAPACDVDLICQQLISLLMPLPHHLFGQLSLQLV